ncbi:OmpA family protein [Cellulosimicrobium protaetiae]|uniref:OmpA family protein n=1 Tax=Cellulosimicrobium protaetiae TaxID=2587808 RepID=A0A6M5UL39_9MICO|nr:OmpA family protein [Cellulosimicrobium protaetiae]QJW37509.1 OmpA family protein [Cellulosimicrobium protaetiae]
MTSSARTAGRSPRVRAVRTAAATFLGAVLVAAPLGPTLPAAASDDGSDRHDELVAEVEQELAAEREAILDATPPGAITDAMREDAVHPLNVDDSTFPLDVEDATTRLETTREDAGETVVVLTSDLLFPFDESALTPAAAAALAELVDQIPQGAAVAVDGHTDSMGTDARNDELSVARAESVAAVLRAERPDLTLTVGGHGSREPVAENIVGGEDNPAGRALNRRVELSFEDG